MYVFALWRLAKTDIFTLPTQRYDLVSLVLNNLAGHDFLLAKSLSAESSISDRQYKCCRIPRNFRRPVEELGRARPYPQLENPPDRSNLSRPSITSSFQLVPLNRYERRGSSFHRINTGHRDHSARVSRKIGCRCNQRAYLPIP